MAQSTKLFFKHIVRKIFLEDWVMKLVALAITLALWLGVTGLSTPTTERLRAIPLDLRSSTDIEVTNTPIQEVDLVVTGDKRKLAGIMKESLRVSMDISDVMPGDRVINLLPATVSVSLPTGVKLDEIQPNRIAVRIEAVEEKEVPVRAVTVGDLPPGYEIYSQAVSPPRVGVRGPSGSIRPLEVVLTESIDLSNRAADFTARAIPIGVPNPKITVLRDTVVDVAFRIGEKRVERVYSVPLADGSGRRANVVLFGARSLFENLVSDDLQVQIIRNDAGEEAPRVILPAPLEGRVEIRNVRVR